MRIYENEGWREAGFEELKGRTVKAVTGLEAGSSRVEFETTDGHRWVMEHDQDCCESVAIVDVAGDPAKLVGMAIEEADVSSREADRLEVSDSGTWTFYRLGCLWDRITIRWLGESNGYYSESVGFWTNAPKAAEEPA